VTPPDRPPPRCQAWVMPMARQCNDLGIFPGGYCAEHADHDARAVEIEKMKRLIVELFLTSPRRGEGRR
jgi:hypothetical protein